MSDDLTLLLERCADLESEVDKLEAKWEKARPYLERELERTSHFLAVASAEMAAMAEKEDFSYKVRKEGEFFSKEEFFNEEEEKYYELKKLLEGR